MSNDADSRGVAGALGDSGGEGGVELHPCDSGAVAGRLALESVYPETKPRGRVTYAGTFDVWWWNATASSDASLAYVEWPAEVDIPSGSSEDVP